MLQVQGLTYRIGGRVLLENASLTVPTGHRAGLIGRNGIGKSTLFKIVLGELTAEAGSTTIPRNARVGTVAQEAPGGSEINEDWTPQSSRFRQCFGTPGLPNDAVRVRVFRSVSASHLDRFAPLQFVFKEVTEASQHD